MWGDWVGKGLLALCGVLGVWPRLRKKEDGGNPGEAAKSGEEGEGVRDAVS
jgi:hypothetical protein